MVKRSKTIYLNNTKRRKRPTNKKAIIGAVVGVAMLAGVSVALLPNAYRITVGEEVIGVVAKKEYIEAAMDTVEAQLQRQYSTPVKIDPIDEIKKVRASRKDLLDPNKLPALLREELAIEIELQELYVDGTKVAVIESKESLEELKTALKKKYFDDTTVRADFANEVKLVSVYTTEDQLIPLDEVVDLCAKRQKQVVTYEVQPGDSLSRIASTLGCNITDILKANEGMTETTVLRIGQAIQAEVRVPLLGLEMIVLPEVATPGE